MSKSDAHMSQRGKLEQWIPGPFVVMTLGQHCFECRVYIVPGATAYKCAGGTVCCAGCQS